MDALLLLLIMLVVLCKYLASMDLETQFKFLLVRVLSLDLRLNQYHGHRMGALLLLLIILAALCKYLALADPEIQSKLLQVRVWPPDTGPYSVSWSPDGRFIAVVNNGDSTLQIFRFNGSGNPIQVGSDASTGSGPESVSWSSDGCFIAVVCNSIGALQIFRFNASDTPTQIGNKLLREMVHNLSHGHGMDALLLLFVQERQDLCKYLVLITLLT